MPPAPSDASTVALLGQMIGQLAALAESNKGVAEAVQAQPEQIVEAFARLLDAREESALKAHREAERDAKIEALASPRAMRQDSTDDAGATFTIGRKTIVAVAVAVATALGGMFLAGREHKALDRAPTESAQPAKHE